MLINIEENNLEMIKSLLKKDKNLVNCLQNISRNEIPYEIWRRGRFSFWDPFVCNTAKITPLKFALICGNENISKLLLDLGALVDAKDDLCESHIEAAVGSGSINACQLLLEHGASVNSENNDMETALFQAVKMNDLKMCDFLIEKMSSVNKENYRGRTPLFKATEIGCFEICNLLINAGASIDIEDNFGESPLFAAAGCGSVKICELLIQLGAQVNKENRRGETPLFMTSNSDIVALLIKHGASLYKKDNDNQTVLSIAIERGREKVFKFLINYGSSGNELDYTGKMF